MNHAQANSIRRALDKGQYEMTEQGLLLKPQRIIASGLYEHWVNGKDYRADRNLVVDEGLMHFLDVCFHDGAKVSTWYLSLYAAAYTPVAGLTAASYPATASEITSGTEGYTEATRVAFVEGAPAANAISNTASKANFTIATASQLSVNGAALHSVSTKGATTGILASAVKFAATRTLYDTDVFTLGYSVALASA